ncbi:glycosyltransferase family 61 protein [Conexibacter woesei]|uniref:glycosyltransferase family 61 protein n=1 Tax=Conexibacter woesei TaxID=191495 RepID=UPI0003F7264D|nr:glycosyltransferase 61 family protein [Conexibacter woesei]
MRTTPARAVRRLKEISLPPAHRTLAEASGARWREVTAAAPYPVPPATRFGTRAIDFVARLEPVMPALGVLELPGAIVFGGDGWVYDRQAGLVTELSWYGGRRDEVRRREGLPRSPRVTATLPGTSVTLGTNWGRHYGHFLGDALPRLALVGAAGIDLADVDHVLMPPAPETARALVARAGIDPAKVRELADGVAYRTERLHAPTLPGARRQYAALVPDFLRTLGAAPRRRDRRLFVTRRGFRRNPVEQEQLERMAQDAGFEIYDPLAAGDQSRDFAEAEAVVGASGSALNNIAFCAPGTAVVELLSEAHTYPYYLTLSAAGGLRYGYIAGRSRDSARRIGASLADFHVDPDAFAQALDWSTR